MTYTTFLPPRSLLGLERATMCHRCEGPLAAGWALIPSTEYTGPDGEPVATPTALLLCPPCRGGTENAETMDIVLRYEYESEDD